MTARLIVLRGNSGSGKSSVARALRAAYGRGVAWIEQDHVRRIMFQERDEPDGANITAIEQLAHHALDHGFHTVVEGILPAVRYGAMLARLASAYDGRGSFYYFDIPFGETVRRHATRPQAREFTADDMREWYRRRDLLGTPVETVIDDTSSLETTVRRILGETGLAR